MDRNPRQRLVASTISLIRERGVAGTGVADLVEHSGAARRSIYQHFPRGKEELVEEATRAAGRFVDTRFDDFAAIGISPRDGIAEIVAIFKRTLVDDDFDAGCPIAAAALAGPSAPGARTVAGEVFSEWTTRLQQQLRHGGVAEARARSLATTILCAVEGALILAIATQSTQPLDDVGEQLSALVDSALDGVVAPIHE